MTADLQILGLETSTNSATIALLVGARPIGQQTLDARQRSAQTLAPAIVSLLEETSWKPRDIGLIAVNLGPGSFTGLRVGVTTAKTLAYAIGADVIGVGALEVIATQATGDHATLDVVVDAQRQQVYAGRFRKKTGEPLRTLGEPHVVDASAWISTLTNSVAVTGPGLTKLQQRLPAGVSVIDPSEWTPRAVTVGQVGFRAYQSGRRDDLWKLTPQYYRKCAAEEKWDHGKSAKSSE
jgi:tRNA threonylcarbamoyladenosine biosynthesis protein TsaB